jgi:hypothetical protein
MEQVPRRRSNVGNHEEEAGKAQQEKIDSTSGISNSEGRQETKKKSHQEAKGSTCDATETAEAAEEHKQCCNK